MVIDQDVYTQNLLQELRRVLSEFAIEGDRPWGAQQRMAEALGVAKPTLCTVLKGKRPGTGKCRGGGLTFIQKVWRYAWHYREEPDRGLINALIAFSFRDSAFLPVKKKEEK